MAVCFLRALSVLGWKIMIISFDSLKTIQNGATSHRILEVGKQMAHDHSQVWAEPWEKATDFPWASPKLSTPSSLTLDWKMSWRQVEYGFTLWGPLKVPWGSSGSTELSRACKYMVVMWSVSFILFEESRFLGPEYLPVCFLSCCPVGSGAPALYYLLNSCWVTVIIRYLLLGMGFCYLYTC